MVEQMLGRQLLSSIVTVEQAAETQGLSERMLGRWMKGRARWEAEPFLTYMNLQQ